ncbi:MAG: cytochrome oxidase small assembly protein [Betaproteobacteria bacterium]
MDNNSASTSQKTSSANKRMGLTLMSIALVFFVAIIIKRTFLG